MAASEKTVRVWDAVVRYFHWLLVLSFASAYVTQEDFLGLHVFAGYTIGLLLLLRVVWGLIGTRYARFSQFVYRPRAVLGYLKNTLKLRAPRYLGHNPAGGAMIVLLLVSLVVTVITGMVVYGAGDHAGPLASVAGGAWLEDVFEEIHEFFANFTLTLVVVHLAGVLFESVVHRENLVRAMWTGRKKVIE